MTITGLSNRVLLGQYQKKQCKGLKLGVDFFLQHPQFTVNFKAGVVKVSQHSIGIFQFAITFETYCTRKQKPYDMGSV